MQRAALYEHTQERHAKYLIYRVENINLETAV